MKHIDRDELNELVECMFTSVNQIEQVLGFLLMHYDTLRAIHFDFCRQQMEKCKKQGLKFKRSKIFLNVHQPGAGGGMNFYARWCVRSGNSRFGKDLKLKNGTQTNMRALRAACQDWEWVFVRELEDELVEVRTVVRDMRKARSYILRVIRKYFVREYDELKQKKQEEWSKIINHEEDD